MSAVKKITQSELYPLKAIKNQQDYEAALKSMELVFDETEGYLAEYAETLSILIEYYEETCFPLREATGRDMLKFLMEQNGLEPEDLTKISEENISYDEILDGKVPLNINHIKLLAKYFHVKPATFV